MSSKGPELHGMLQQPVLLALGHEQLRHSAWCPSTAAKHPTGGCAWFGI